MAGDDVNERPIAPPPPPSPRAHGDLIGEVLDGRYRVEALIDVGGMGSVYRGVQERLDKPIAIKVLDLSFGDLPKLTKRFTREARAMAAIRHPNVVEVFDFGQTPTCAYLVMELLSGCPLGELIGEGQRMSWRQLRPIALQIVRALGASHRAGVIHRDLKPSNVFLLDEDGSGVTVKVLDFGIAKINDGLQLTQQGSVFGTAHYMAPEQATGEPVDGRTDLYALGCLLFEALTGRVPFQGGTYIEVLGKQVKEASPTMASVAPSLLLPEGLEEVIARTLAKRPGHRYATMAALAQALEAVPVLPPGGKLGDAVALDLRGQRGHLPAAPGPLTSPLRGDATADYSAVLEALAFTFVTLGHAPDAKLDDDEIAAIRERLSRWRPSGLPTLDPRTEAGDAETVEGLVDRTFEGFKAIIGIDARLAKAWAHMDWLAKTLSQSARRRVLDDMWAIANADGRLIMLEERFLADAAERFGLPDPVNARRSGRAPSPAVSARQPARDHPRVHAHTRPLSSPSDDGHGPPAPNDDDPS